jgi:hypothetical protein
MKDSLPLYTIHISDKDWSEEEVDFVSLVEYPAIQKNFLAFKSELNVQTITNEFSKCDKFRFSLNDEQRVLTGPAMIADLPIYRNNDTLGEHYVLFTAEEIKKIVQKLFKKNYIHNVNIEHNKKVDGVYMFESYFIDRNFGKSPIDGFEDITDGSWFVSYKVENDEVWEDAKNGKFKGFSIEGIFRYGDKPIMTKEEELLNSIINILNKIEH